MAEREGWVKKVKCLSKKQQQFIDTGNSIVITRGKGSRGRYRKVKEDNGDGRRKNNSSSNYLPVILVY